jgi:hypothetical protein
MGLVTASIAPAHPACSEQTFERSLIRGGAALRIAVSCVLLSTTVGQSLGINFGSYSLNMALLGMYGCLAVAAASGVLSLSHRRLVLYVAGMTAALTSFLVNANFARGDQSSLSSLLLLTVMYLPFIFTLHGGSSPSSRWVVRHFLDIALFCALAGVLQFLAQFVIKADWLFDFSAHLPAVLQGPKGFNTVIPVGTLFKSNGFFFREPSGFSFIMAFALVCECILYKRTFRIACFALALLLTYSGTGLLALLVAVAFPLGARTLKRFALLAVGGGLTLLLFGDVLNLSFTLGRIQEFGAERSSAYIRYVAPLRLIGDTFGAEPWTLWLGHGPGTVFRQIVAYEYHDPTWSKLIVEYGLVGFAVFVTLFLAVLSRSTLPTPIRATLFFYWLVMGGHLLSPEVNFMTLVLVGMLPGCLPQSSPGALPLSLAPASRRSSPRSVAPQPLEIRPDHD